MNRVLKYFVPLANRYPDIHVRLFIYISAVVVIWVFNYVLIGLLMGLGAASILALLAGDIFIAVIAVLSVRFKKTYLGGACITVFLNFVLFPVNFYISGGPFGGTLVWFVASLLFIDIALTDRTQTIFFLMSLVVCLTCCYISLFRQ